MDTFSYLIPTGTKTKLVKLYIPIQCNSLNDTISYLKKQNLSIPDEKLWKKAIDDNNILFNFLKFSTLPTRYVTFLIYILPNMDWPWVEFCLYYLDDSNLKDYNNNNNTNNNNHITLNNRRKQAFIKEMKSLSLLFQIDAIDILHLFKAKKGKPSYSLFGGIDSRYLNINVFKQLKLYVDEQKAMKSDWKIVNIVVLLHQINKKYEQDEKDNNNNKSLMKLQFPPDNLSTSFISNHEIEQNFHTNQNQKEKEEGQEETLKPQFPQRKKQKCMIPILPKIIKNN